MCNSHVVAIAPISILVFSYSRGHFRIRTGVFVFRIRASSFRIHPIRMLFSYFRIRMDRALDTYRMYLQGVYLAPCVQPLCPYPFSYFIFPWAMHCIQAGCVFSDGQRIVTYRMFFIFGMYPLHVKKFTGVFISQLPIPTLASHFHVGPYGEPNTRGEYPGLLVAPTTGIYS